MARSDESTSEESAGGSSTDGGSTGGSTDGESAGGSTTGTSTGDESTRNVPVGEQAADWLAASTLRIALTLIGFVLLLFAIGQAVGMDLLGIVVDALNTGIGRWLVVAFVGLLLIAFALRGFDDGNA